MADAISQDWIVELIAIVEKAGAAILEVYSTDFEIQRKNDESPLTQADLAAHRDRSGFASPESADPDHLRRVCTTAIC